MSRWISLGLRTGIKTTDFPRELDVDAASAPSAIALRPQSLTPSLALAAARACPTKAIEAHGDEETGSLAIDLGQCIMCGRCVRAAPDSFHFVSDPRVAVRTRERLQTRVWWSEAKISQSDGRIESSGASRTEESRRIFKRSLHIRHVDAGSCNAAESELQMLTSPYYDLNRLGLFFTPTPRHADVLLVTGLVTRQMEQPLLDTYEAMPRPKLVIAAGVCPIGGGVFADGFMTRGPLDRLLPVDIYVPGSPPTPLALLHGLLLAAGKAGERLRVMEDA